MHNSVFTLWPQDNIAWYIVKHLRGVTAVSLCRFRHCLFWNSAAGGRQCGRGEDEGQLWSFPWSCSSTAATCLLSPRGQRATIRLVSNGWIVCLVGVLLFIITLTQWHCLGAPYRWTLSIFLCVGGQRCYHNTTEIPHKHTYFKPTLSFSFWFFFFGFLSNPAHGFARALLPSSLECVHALWIIQKIIKICSINSPLSFAQGSYVWLKELTHVSLSACSAREIKSLFKNILGTFLSFCISLFPDLDTPFPLRLQSFSLLAPLLAEAEWRYIWGCQVPLFTWGV